MASQQDQPQQDQPQKDQNQTQKCSICLLHNYSLHMVIHYNGSRKGCGTLVCIDCYLDGKIKECLICKSRIKMIVADRTMFICNAMDKKYGKFECPTCGEKVKRCDYFEHFEMHRCNCRVTCQISETICGIKLHKCNILKHAIRCGACKNKYCSLCFEMYSNGAHKLSDCICENGKNIMCKKKESIVLHDGCMVYKQEEKKIALRDFCTCGFSNKIPIVNSSDPVENKHDCEIYENILRMIEHYKEYEKQFTYLIDTKKLYRGGVDITENMEYDLSRSSRKRKVGEMS